MDSMAEMEFFHKNWVMVLRAIALISLFYIYFTTSEFDNYIFVLAALLGGPKLFGWIFRLFRPKALDDGHA